MGLPAPRTRNSLRFSPGPSNTADEIDFVIDRLPALVTKLRHLGRTVAALR
jgi:cysteine sulfinate desulfinase/cysteine desulfurase-like protein